MKREKFRIIKRTYGSGKIVFIPQYLALYNEGLYKTVCDDMCQAISFFATEKEALDKIEEYKIFKRGLEIVSEEIIKVDDGNFLTKAK
jgi:hypothetical protein